MPLVEQNGELINTHCQALYFECFHLYTPVVYQVISKNERM